MSDEVELKIKIKSASLKNLESQMQFLKKLKMPELENMKSVTDLISFYLDHISLAPSQLNNAVSVKMEEIFNTLSQKGLSYQSIMDAFSAGTITAEIEEELFEEDDDEEAPVTPKPEKKS